MEWGWGFSLQPHPKAGFFVAAGPREECSTDRFHFPLHYVLKYSIVWLEFIPLFCLHTDLTAAAQCFMNPNIKYTFFTLPLKKISYSHLLIIFRTHFFNLQKTCCDSDMDCFKLQVTLGRMDILKTCFQDQAFSLRNIDRLFIHSDFLSLAVKFGFLNTNLIYCWSKNFYVFCCYWECSFPF